jgi:hypothetical protein
MASVARVESSNVVASGPICILSHGMGQDSACLLSLLTDPNRPEVWERYVGGAELIVVHSDTGNEHQATVDYRTHVRDLCAEHGITYVQVDLEDGFHTGAWRFGLVGQWQANHTIGSAAYPATCSDSLKVQPIWKAINAFCGKRFGVSDYRKGGLKEHLRRYGAIPTIIGIAKGEEKRIRATAQLPLLPQEEDTGWFATCVKRIYPLMDMGMDRAAAQAYLRSRNQPVPRPSNCQFCPYKSRQEVLHLARTDEKAFARWSELEDDKRRHNAAHPHNYGVKGKKMLREFYAEAERMYGHLTIEQLEAHVMSHGHCTPSKH